MVVWKLGFGRYGWKSSSGFGVLLAFFLVIMGFTMVEGRVITTPPMMVRQEKTILRSEMGSRPPLCAKRCSTCEQCKPIQVPANPATGIKTTSPASSSSSLSSLMEVEASINVAYARGDYVSSYKPMSWKCKCGNSIFNP